MNRSAFTLIELLVVIAIIAVLMGVLVYIVRRKQIYWSCYLSCFGGHQGD